MLLTTGGIGYLIYWNLTKLEYDYERGEVASAKVEDAQYLPDVEKILNGGDGPALLSSTDVENIDELEFRKLIDSLGTIENVSGAGKYLGYDIYEIKEEIAFVLDKAPVFEQWFRMPTMREKEGYVMIPYYEWWAYYIEMDEETGELTITRVCWSTRTSHLDWENEKSIEDHADGSSNIQFDVMQMKYYVNEAGDEVVECFMFDVGVENSRRHYNDDINSYKPYEYLYLKNVKDKSLTKYHVVSSERYRDDETFDEGGMDVTNNNPYGTSRDFLYMDYTDSDNMQILKISEVLPTNVYRMAQTTNIIFYNEIDGVLEYYASAHDYYDSNTTVKHQLNKPFVREGVSLDFDLSLSNYSRYPSYKTTGVVYSENPSRVEKKNIIATTEADLINHLSESLVNLALSVGVEEEEKSDLLAQLNAYNTLATTNNVYEKKVDNLLDVMCKDIVDDSELKQNWPEIYAGQRKARELRTIKGPFYKETIKFTDFRNRLDFVYADDNTFDADVTIDLTDEFDYDTDGEYTIALAFKKENSDKYHIISDIEYGRIEEVYYNGSTTETYKRFDMTASTLTGDLDNLDIKEAGDYLLYIVILMKVGNEDRIIFDSKQQAYALRYKHVGVADTYFEENGKNMKSSYQIDATGKRIKLKVTVTEV